MRANDLRRILCWLLRGHKWRRYRKGEHGLGSHTVDGPRIRICTRCGATRLAAKRNRKPQEPQA